MNSLNFFASAFTWRSSKPRAAPAFSTSPSGSQSIWIMTRVLASSSRWKVTTPACLASPLVLVHATRSSGCCSVISASNSRFTPSMLVTQWVRLSSSWVIRSTPPMNWGKSSNCVHWSYATRIGTSTSTDSCTLAMAMTLLSLGGLVVHDLPRPVRPQSGVVGRKGEYEPRSAPRGGVQHQRAPVPLGDVARDGQPQPRAAVGLRPRLVEPGEPLEHPLDVRGGDPRAVVGDGQHCTAAVLGERDCH